MKKGSLIALLIIASIVAGAIIAVAQESVTLTTYYPSPKGVYDEIRANKLASIDAPDEYFIEMKTGRAVISEVALKDKRTGDLYSLSMQNGQFIISDARRKKGFMVIDFNQPQPPPLKR